MTLVELLHQLRGGPMRDFCLAALYHEQRYRHRVALTTDALRKAMLDARVKGVAKANIADILAKAAPYVTTSGKSGNKLLWCLTDTGQVYVRSILGLPPADIEIEHDVSALQIVISSIADERTAEYIKEAATCLGVGVLRAAVVFVWAGAVHRIQQEVFDRDITQVNTALTRFDARARTIRQLSDLEYVKESTLLLVAEALGIYDRNERSVLEDALDLRNKCGHPGDYRPGPNRVRSFIEDVVGIVFA